MLIFGPTIDQALKSDSPIRYLGDSTKEFIADTVMNYICLGHRLWFFISFIVLPSLIGFIKVTTN